MGMVNSREQVVFPDALLRWNLRELNTKVRAFPRQFDTKVPAATDKPTSPPTHRIASLPFMMRLLYGS